MSEPTHDETTATLPVPPAGRSTTPASRRRRSVAEETAGAAVTLSDGNTWFLAPTGVAPILDEVRDRIYDEAAWASKVRMSDVFQAAWVALLANYDLADDELATLLTGLDDEQEAALVRATNDALFGSVRPNRTYSEWALASLHANGLDPAKIPPRTVPDVLDILVRTGRTVPEEKWIGSAIAASERGNMIAMMTPRP